MRPTVTLVMALSADGKISPGRDVAPRFGAADAYRFERICSEADALVTGAGSLRAQGGTRTIVHPALVEARRERGQPPQPLTCVVSRSGRLDPTIPFFTRQEVPRAIATTDQRAQEAGPQYAGLAQLWACGAAQVEPQCVLDRLAEVGAQRVALLGGGELNAAWFAAGVVDRLELTVAPILFGGGQAPTPIDGSGLALPMALVLENNEVADDGCVFLTYRVARAD